MRQDAIDRLIYNTSLNNIEAEEFIAIVEKEKSLTIVNDICFELWDNWSIFDSYDEAWEHEQKYGGDLAEEEFKRYCHKFETGRCIVKE